MKPIHLTLALLVSGSAMADPKLTSWFTDNSGQYARIYPTVTAVNADTKSNTWSRGGGNHYSSGTHRSETLDPNLAKHPENGLNLGAEDQAALVAFLKTLTTPPAVLNK